MPASGNGIERERERENVVEREREREREREMKSQSIHGIVTSRQTRESSRKKSKCIELHNKYSICTCNIPPNITNTVCGTLTTAAYRRTG
jgi:hypothetical protein